ncbi:TlpA family protein disulfide reductase [Cellulomonas endophytica]|uniref:TlpA family protein disulfide reductase n=1 Tax=Cellulomonas endophytica TaxID=2494735 RepID=UPI001F0C7CB4|nr:TlpA disulfide reductase family protein [Cellulomonas endophytica]
MQVPVQVLAGGRWGRARRALAAALLVALAAGGCSAGGGGGGGGTADVVDQGYQSGDGSTTQWPAAERPGPVELVGTDYEGGTQDVSAWRGDVVVLNTWYAACPPCRAEAPDLVAVAEEYADRGVHVLGINGTDAAGAAQPFQERFGVPYPSLEDTDGSAVASLQGTVPVNAVPTTVVLDRQGRVAARVLGLVEGSTLRAVVEELLAEEPA